VINVTGWWWWPRVKGEPHKAATCCNPTRISLESQPFAVLTIARLKRIFGSLCHGFVQILDSVCAVQGGCYNLNMIMCNYEFILWC
jgi:hypothetical protein